jgi:hypothetical protein
MGSEQIRGGFRVITTIRALVRPGDAGRRGAVAIQVGIMLEQIPAELNREGDSQDVVGVRF